MSYGGLFLGFARVGVLGFGGGPAMIPLMQSECVSNGWVTDDQFLEGLSVSNALPGPLATKMALYVGYQDAGVGGAAAAMSDVLLPSTLLMAVVGALLVRYRDHWVVAAAMRALKPAIIGMLAFVAWDLAPAAIKGMPTLLVAVAAFVALAMKVHPALVIVLSVVLGLLLFRG